MLFAPDQTHSSYSMVSVLFRFVIVLPITAGTIENTNIQMLIMQINNLTLRVI